MRFIHHIFTKVPLIVRVVPLYVATATVIWWAPQVAGEMQTQPQTTIQTETVSAPVEAEVIQGIPVHLSIPRIGLERDIINGTYDSSIGDWTLTDDKVQYATMTGLLSDQSGQTLLYGHNTAQVIEPVRLVEPGDELVVTADNGHVFHYKYTTDRIVEPSDVSVLYEQPDRARLVLMTCEGVFSSTRRLLYFELQEVV